MCMKCRTFSKKEMSIVASLLPKLLNPEEAVTQTSKRSSFRNHSVMNVLTIFKHCLNQHGITINLLSRKFELN